MNKAKALKVLAEVEEQFGTDEPALYDHNHEELSEGSWSIAREGSGRDCWPADFTTATHGVFTEPSASWCLGVFDS